MLITNIHNEPQVDFEERQYYTDIRDDETFDHYMTRLALESHPEEFTEEERKEMKNRLQEWAK